MNVVFSKKNTNDNERAIQLINKTNQFNLNGLRKEPEDPRAISLKGQLDDLSLNIKGLPNRLATINEALRVQILVEDILSRTN